MAEHWKNVFPWKPRNGVGHGEGEQAGHWEAKYMRLGPGCGIHGQLLVTTEQQDPQMRVVLPSTSSWVEESVNPKEAEKVGAVERSRTHLPHLQSNPSLLGAVWTSGNKPGLGNYSALGASPSATSSSVCPLGFCLDPCSSIS
jgi:hypothetical protein